MKTIRRLIPEEYKHLVILSLCCPRHWGVIIASFGHLTEYRIHYIYCDSFQMKRRKTKTVTGAAQVTQVRSGQVRSGCCSARLSRAHVQTFTGTGNKKGGGGGISRTGCTGGYKGVRAVRPGSVAGGGCLR